MLPIPGEGIAGQMISIQRAFRIAFMFAAGLLPGAAEAKTFVLLTENLEMPGAWLVESDTGITKGARRYLIAPSPAVETAPAVGAVEMPHAGKWRIWVRSRDFAKDRPGVRFFSLRLGEQKLERKFGTHGLEGQEGWAWEDGGVIEAQAGPLLVVLGETGRHSARCEAIVFTDNMSYVPEGVTWQLNKEIAKLAPLTMSEASKAQFSPPPMTAVEEKAAATLENEKVRLSFHAGKTASGPAMGMKVATRDNGRWVVNQDSAEAASYRVITRPVKSNAAVRYGKVYPTWDTSLSPAVDVSAGAAKAKTRMGPGSVPWLAGKCLPLRPLAALQKDERTVELEFAPTPAGQLRVTWTLEPGRADAAVQMSFQPAQPGQYSLGFHSPVAVSTEDANEWLLPFQFHGRQFPKDPALLLSTTTPTPLALVNAQGVSTVVVAEPEDGAFEWPRADRARYGFGLRNETGFVQPMIYSPVMGLPGSLSEGGPVTAKFRYWVQRGDWYAAYRGVADGLFALRDYREPTTFSMTDTVFNLLDLMRDEAASGWDARAKASVQIESRNTVTQSSPLAYLSLYLLTGDRGLYEKLARPSLEFLLSRPMAHFAVEAEIMDNYYQHQPMQGPVRMFGAATYASALAMTHGRSGAFGELAFTPEHQLRRTQPHGHGQPFDDALALYRTTGDVRWLEEAKANAEKYLTMINRRGPVKEPGDRQFVNVSYSSNWEGLLHLYEATGEKRYLAAAEEGARALLTSIWTQPKISREQKTTLNPGGIYDAGRWVWWWGNSRKRLGLYEGPPVEEVIDLPAPKIAEREVPAWTVSNVGLGLEHPFTYVRGGGQANIMMSVWAANFLRMTQATGDPAFRVAARNSLIGRYANYPGYYLDGPTDEFRRADYPIKGPDVTSLYVHHIAPFTASLVDFLFTDAELRSQGKIVFPTARQMGYVWFDSRLWGHAPGRVYEDEAWPWLNRAAVTLDNPGVDHLLAEGNGKLHVILMNQSQSAQSVKLKLDEPTLGRSVQQAELAARLDGKTQPRVPIKDGVAEVSLPVNGLLVLTLDGVKIDVLTHRVKPPQQAALSKESAITRVKLGDTKWQTIATTIDAPPFEWRDFHAYLNCGREDLKSAVLLYRIGEGPEQRVEVKAFPFEFSVRVDDPKQSVTWKVEAQFPDGTWVK